MQLSYSRIVATIATIILFAAPASAQTTRYVEAGATGTTCTLLDKCGSIQAAHDLSSAGDVINVAAGAYTESVIVTRSVSVVCALANVPIPADGTSRGAESIITAAASTSAPFTIRTGSVSINGCDLVGGADAWAGVQIWNSGTAAAPDDISNIDIEYNRIRDISKANPNGTFNYAYGVWAMGGGSATTTRGTISDLVINQNRFTGIGDGTDIGTAPTLTTEQGGVGVYVKSISGATAGAGATITNNVFTDIAQGFPSLTTSTAGGTVDCGIGIAVLQDTETSTSDSGILIAGNTYGNPTTPDLTGPYVGVVSQTAATTISEDLADFDDGTSVVALIANLTHPDFSDLPISTIDYSGLSTATTAVYSVSGLTLSASAGVPNSIGVFRTIAAASANSSSGAIMPQPQDGTTGGAVVTFAAGPSIVFTFANGDTFTIPLSAYTGASPAVTPAIVGNEGDDAITVSTDLLLYTDLVVDLGEGTDELIIDPVTAPCVVEIIEHDPTTTTDGSIDFTFDGGTCVAAVTSTITYLGLEPIDDSGNFPLHRIFNFDPLAETIVLRDDEVAGTNVSFIDSELVESYLFGNPTLTLTINAGGGDDILDLGPILNAAGSTPAIDVIVNGDTGADTFVVDPADGYTSFTLNGGSPAICPGDALTVEIPTGATADFSTAGQVTFTGVTLDQIDYTGIEAFTNNSADISITITAPLYPGDVATFTLTVTNNGADTAQCITIADAVPTGVSFTSGPTASSGTIVGTDWIINSLANAGVATLTGTVFVNTADPTSATVSTQSTDPGGDNNSAGIVGDMFGFPAKAHAQAALVYPYMVSNVPLERIILGLYNGSPGRSSAVLCSIPEPDGVIFTVDPTAVVNRWRECGTGLPYPLHVNDIYYDEGAGRIWLASWGSAGLYYSEDGGYTWSEAVPDLPDGHEGTVVENPWVNVYAIAQDANDILYISANNGLLFRSLDAGMTWQGISSLPDVSADTPWSLEADPTLAGVVYAGTFGKGIWRTTNFGQTWEPLIATTTASGTPVDALYDENAGHVFDLEFSPDDASLLYAGTAKGVWRVKTDDLAAGYVDMGLTHTLDSGVVTPEVRGIAFGPSDGDADLYMATWGFGVYIDEDPNLSAAGGQTQVTLRESKVTFVAVGPGGLVYAGTESGGFHAISMASATDVAPGADTDLPVEYALSQNYPNPFNPVTTVAFAMPKDAQARLEVFDMLGRRVALLADGVFTAGTHQVQFDARNLPSGTYIYRLATPEYAEVRQMVLMK